MTNGSSIKDLIKNPDKIDGVMKSLKFYKDGFDEDNIQLWSRRKGVERILSDSLVENGKFIIRLNIVENCFEYPANMISLVGSPIIVNGFIKLEDSPGLISLEGFPRSSTGSINIENYDNINPNEQKWLFSNTKKDFLYNNYWEDYFQYLKNKVLDSNLPIKYLKELSELNIIELSIEKTKLRINKTNSYTTINKFKL